MIDWRNEKDGDPLVGTSGRANERREDGNSGKANGIHNKYLCDLLNGESS